MPKTPARKPPMPAVRSVADFIETILTLPSDPDTTYAFRGVRNAVWENVPGIMRSGRERLLQHEAEAVRDLVSIHPNEFTPDTSMFDKLVRMQHFGLPTRLLDVTLNPLAALYFATETVGNKLEAESDGKVFIFNIPRIRRKYFDSDTISCLTNLANLSAVEKELLLTNKDLPTREFNELKQVDRLIQFIRVEKPFFRPMIKCEDLLTVQFVVPKLNNRRIIAQNGAFLLFGLEVEGRIVGEIKIQTWSWTVAKRSKESIRESLDKLSINESSLFPEIDRAAGYVAKRFLG
jgi:hypothetical protein